MAHLKSAPEQQQPETVRETYDLVNKQVYEETGKNLPTILTLAGFNITLLVKAGRARKRGDMATALYFLTLYNGMVANSNAGYVAHSISKIRKRIKV